MAAMMIAATTLCLAVSIRAAQTADRQRMVLARLRRIRLS